MSENQSDPSMAHVTRAAAHREYRRAQRTNTLDALTGEAGHNLSELFHVAEGALQMSQNHLSAKNIVREYLDRAFEGVDGPEDLVQRLLAFGQRETAAGQESVDLVPLVQEVASLATFAFPRALTLRTRVDDAGVVTGSRSRLRRLVAELVVTAARSMEGQWHECPTVLDVSARRMTADADLAKQCLHLEPGGYVHLAVSATGTGRPGSPKDGGRLDAEGDLFAARDIAEAHDGTLTVRREEEGLAFNAFLPIATADDAPAPHLPDPPAAERDGHVLVADGDETMRILECSRISRLGYEVTQKSDAHQALSAVEHAPGAFDVALVDHHLPGMNGLEVAHAFRKRGCEAPVVLMTGIAAQTSEAKARVVGIDHLLRKPVERRELSEMLAQFG